MALRVLLATTAQWLSTARLAAALAEVGCQVEAVCRPGHPLEHVSSVGRRYNFSATSAAASFERAIVASAPDLVLSCDEPALGYLKTVHAGASPAVRALIERSIGDIRQLDTALARSALLELAQQEGIATPATSILHSAADVDVQIEKLGLPLVLKADATAGGQGVRVLTRRSDARTFYTRLRGPVSAPRTLSRVLRDRDLRPVFNYFERRTTVVTAQEFIEGPEGNVGVACWQGEVLACLTLEVVTTWCVRGPSSVLRVVDNPAMASAARKLVRRLNFTGFCGFDFIFRADGTPLLLEMNARPTQIAHLALGPGKDLAAAFAFAAAGGRASGVLRHDRPACTSNPLIALFPQEWQRDPESDMLLQAFHDVPWSEPGLVTAGMNAHVSPGGSRPWDPLLALFRKKAPRPTLAAPDASNTFP